MRGKSKKKHEKEVPSYAHNPHYCMIVPDAVERDGDDIASTGQS